MIDGFIVDSTKCEIDTMTDGMLKMKGVFANMERNMISEHVKSGMATVIAKGKIIRQPITTIENLPISFIKHYPKYRERQINKMRLAKLCSMNRQSVYKYMKLYENE